MPSMEENKKMATNVPENVRTQEKPQIAQNSPDRLKIELNTPVEALESTGDGIEEVDGDHMRDVQSKTIGDGNDKQNGDNDSDNRESSSDIDPQKSAHLPTPKNARQQLTFVTKVIHPTHRASAQNH
ncbi:hypothetical protein V8B97DRAFT_1916501 [Scleroderma yunnanense]